MDGPVRLGQANVYLGYMNANVYLGYMNANVYLGYMNANVYLGYMNANVYLGYMNANVYPMNANVYLLCLLFAAAAAGQASSGPLPVPGADAADLLWALRGGAGRARHPALHPPHAVLRRQEHPRLLGRGGPQRAAGARGGDEWLPIVCF
ncbi:hypothetical protein CEXT_612941 [Caerostris extrusa]|uniref:Uncharacterized protein n=1 Tax=Caerostris extrusa TaxID=172846 RepID=A0AAV4V1P4_CAEEX|nr:hypothetical protein CEXT_612941 [Caerostris extrusa]